jgi:hypothetical protein
MADHCVADNYVCSMYDLKEILESRAPERDGGFALKGTDGDALETISPRAFTTRCSPTHGNGVPAGESSFSYRPKKNSRSETEEEW